MYKRLEIKLKQNQWDYYHNNHNDQNNDSNLRAILKPAFFIFRMIGDPVFSGTVQSAPVMAAIYMSGISHADLVRSFFPEIWPLFESDRYINLSVSILFRRSLAVVRIQWESKIQPLKSGITQNLSFLKFGIWKVGPELTNSWTLWSCFNGEFTIWILDTIWNST